MKRRPFIPFAIASLLIGLAVVVAWIHSVSHFTTARTPTIHHKFPAVVVSQGTALIMEGSSMPHGFRWTRRAQSGPAFLLTKKEIAGFGFGRSIDGSYVIFPLSVVALFSFGATFLFCRVRRVQESPGFAVLPTEAGESIKRADA